MNTQPYLSIVATARNDNHGGNMLRRMQIFIDGVLEQCRRHQLDAELIIVEWNPLLDKPRLKDEFSWGKLENSPCTVRFIEVPSEIHHRLKHSESLPLFQMIAKNVGIRRAKGEFVLATNIDLLFSDELFSFLASRRLESGKLYRIDRHDAASEVPLEASLDEQLRYCEKNLLRICRQDQIEEIKAMEESPSEITEDQSTDPVESNHDPEAEEDQPLPQILQPMLSTLRQGYRQLLPKSVRDRLLYLVPPAGRNWLIQKSLLTVQLPPPVEPELAEPEPEPLLPPPWQYPQLHTNACGDFTLMSHQDWTKVLGYPEWEIFSFHLDSVLMYIAHYAGIQEQILVDPMRIYHVEHASGWTPETERTQTLNQRLSRLGIPQLSMSQFDALVQLMAQLEKPLIFNNKDWGMALAELQETVLGGGDCPMLSTPTATNVSP